MDESWSGDARAADAGARRGATTVRRAGASRRRRPPPPPGPPRPRQRADRAAGPARDPARSVRHPPGGRGRRRRPRRAGPRPGRPGGLRGRERRRRHHRDASGAERPHHRRRRAGVAGGGRGRAGHHRRAPRQRRDADVAAGGVDRRRGPIGAGPDLRALGARDRRRRERRRHRDGRGSAARRRTHPLRTDRTTSACPWPATAPSPSPPARSWRSSTPTTRGIRAIWPATCRPSPRRRPRCGRTPGRCWSTGAAGRPSSAATSGPPARWASPTTSTSTCWPTGVRSSTISAASTPSLPRLGDWDYVARLAELGPPVRTGAATVDLPHRLPGPDHRHRAAAPDPSPRPRPAPRAPGRRPQGPLRRMALPPAHRDLHRRPRPRADGARSRGRGVGPGRGRGRGRDDAAGPPRVARGRHRRVPT